jgi:outer membrane lipoprotein-sorting protein
MRLARALCIILTVASASFAQALTSDQILAKLDEKAKAFQTFEASVVMTQVFSDVKAPSESGKIYMKQGKAAPRVFLDITSPARSVKKAWVQDGKAVMYNRPQNSYQEYRVDPNSNTFQLLLTGLGVPAATLKKHYVPEVKSRETIDGVATEVLDLPLQATQTGQIKKITLWLDPKTWSPVQIRITMKGNDTTEYKYSNVRLNKGISDSVFKLNIPKDAVKQ